MVCVTAVAATVAGAATLSAGDSVSAIVDGDEATAVDNPWQVALVDSAGHFCGGTLVDARAVVTAAHCVSGVPGSEMAVRAGAADLDSEDGQTRQVVTVVEHPRFEATGTGDIAVLVLDRAFDPSDVIAPIPLATPAELAGATTGRVSGWGVTSDDGEASSSILLAADVPIVSDEACTLGIDRADEFCAGGTGTDTCWGDSGGPLTIKSDRGRVLAGVTSWGDSCGGEAPGGLPRYRPSLTGSTRTSPIRALQRPIPPTPTTSTPATTRSTSRWRKPSLRHSRLRESTISGSRKTVSAGSRSRVN